MAPSCETPFDDLEPFAVLRAEEVAARLGVTGRSVRRAIARGELKASRACGLRVLAADAAAWWTAGLVMRSESRLSRSLSRACLATHGASMPPPDGVPEAGAGRYTRVMSSRQSLALCSDFATTLTTRVRPEIAREPLVMMGSGVRVPPSASAIEEAPRARTAPRFSPRRRRRALLGWPAGPRVGRAR